MIKFLEVFNANDFKWQLTFYLVAGIAMIIGLLWTCYKIFKNDKKKQMKEVNTIYDNVEDVIEVNGNTKQ